MGLDFYCFYPTLCFYVLHTRREKNTNVNNVNQGTQTNRADREGLERRNKVFVEVCKGNATCSNHLFGEVFHGDV